MEWLPGETLEQLWPSLSDQEKGSICSQIRDLLSSLHALPLPEPSYFGKLDCRPYIDPLLASFERDPKICGPSETQTQFAASFAFNIQAIFQMNQKYSFKAEWYRDKIRTVFQGHQLVFCHADLQRKNIIIERQQLSDEEETARTLETRFKVSLVNLENAGFYPSFWEYASQFAASDWHDDWFEWLDKILEPCVAEAAVLRMLHQEIL